MSPARVIETEHIIPAPFMAEDAIRSRVADFRAEIVARGGIVVSERRCRNQAFDKRGQTTSTRLIVKWPGPSGELGIDGAAAIRDAARATEPSHD